MSERANAAVRVARAVLGVALNGAAESGAFGRGSAPALRAAAELVRSGGHERRPAPVAAPVATDARRGARTAPPETASQGDAEPVATPLRAPSEGRRRGRWIPSRPCRRRREDGRGEARILRDGVGVHAPAPAPARPRTRRPDQAVGADRASRGRRAVVPDPARHRLRVPRRGSRGWDDIRIGQASVEGTTEAHERLERRFVFSRRSGVHHPRRLDIHDRGERGEAGGRALPHARRRSQARPDALHPGRVRDTAPGATRPGAREAGRRRHARGPARENRRVAPRRRVEGFAAEF